MLRCEETNRNSAIELIMSSLHRIQKKYFPPHFEFFCEQWEPDVLKFYEHQHYFSRQDSIIPSTKTIIPSKKNYKSWRQEDFSDSMHYATTTFEKPGYEAGG